MEDNESKQPSNLDRLHKAHESMMEVARGCASIIGGLWNSSEQNDVLDPPELDAADKDDQQAQE